MLRNIPAFTALLSIFGLLGCLTGGDSRKDTDEPGNDSLGLSWSMLYDGREYDLFSVAWAQGQFVAVGENHVILTSPDGVYWTYRKEPGVSGNDYDLVFRGKNQWVAAKRGGLAASPDGVVWSAVASVSSELDLISVAQGDDTFVGIGEGGGLWTSPDGLSWTRRIPNSFSGLAAVAWKSGLWVAVGSDSVLTSTDAVTWTSRAAGAPAGLTAITWTGSRWVAVGGEGAILTSSNGMDWNRVPIASTTTFRSLAWSGSKLVAGGNREIWTSSNGDQWAKTDSLRRFESIAWSGTQFMGAGDGGTLFSSADGLTWTERTVATPLDLLAITRGNGLFVAVGYGGAVRISQDGLAWARSQSGTTERLRTVASSGTRFIAAGFGALVTSTDGVNWTVSPETVGATHVFWTGQKWVIVGTGGAMLSTDGIQWTTTHLVDMSMQGVTWTGSQFVAVGGLGKIRTSPDAVTWTQQISGTDYDLNSVIWTGTRLVAVGNQSILNSSDGVTWTRMAQELDSAFYGLTSVIKAENRLIASGRSGIFMTSPDGVSWTLHDLGRSLDFYGVATSNERAVAVGDGGAIALSP
jgi:hypothetical protein